MTTERKFKALVLGDLWEIDNIFALDFFQERFPVERINVSRLDDFRGAIEDPTIDLILIDAAPHGLEVLDIVLENPPLRPVIMVADSNHARVIVEAKKRGLERYVIRLEDVQLNVDLLCHEIRTVFEGLVQPPPMQYPTVEHLFRYAHYHNVRQPFFIVDLHRRLLYVNAAGSELIEHLHHRHLEPGDPTEAFFLDASPEQFSAHLERAFEGEHIAISHTFDALAEEERHLQILYQPVRWSEAGVIAVSIACKNVGARRQAEERLQRREEALWTYFDVVPLPLKIVNDEMVIVRCNPAFVELLGFEHAGELEGRPVSAVVHPGDQQVVAATLQSLFSGTEDYFQADTRYCDSLGQTVWANRIGFAFEGPGGQRNRALLVAVDVTSQKEAEQRTEQAMRLEAIGQLAGGVAHDFNNILAIVTAISHGLKIRLSEMHEDDLVNQLDTIQRAVERGASLTHQLLSFSQKPQTEAELIDLNQHIGDVSELLESALGSNIDLVIDLEPGVAPFIGGKGQIDQVTMNLAVNARDAMPKGGTLTIRTYAVHIDPRRGPARLDLQPGDWVVLEIADTGVGMDQVTRRRIFDPFYTTKGPGKGTGMGLTTVYRIVETAGGKIHVDSAPGHGTKFTIYFPAAEPGVKALSDLEAGEESAPSRACILIVEDEDDIREPYRIFLRRLGYGVLDAADIKQARAVIRDAQAAGTDIDLLLADVVLPDGSGVDFARELREEISDLRVIFMSGYAPDLIYGDVHGLGDGWDFLPKPVTRETLLTTVSQALEEGSSVSGE